MLTIYATESFKFALLDIVCAFEKIYIYLFIWKVEWETQICILVVYSPAGCNHHVWTIQSRSPTPSVSPHWVTDVLVVTLSRAAFPGPISREVECKNSQDSDTGVPGCQCHKQGS